MIELMLLRWEDSLGLSEESGLKEDVRLQSMGSQRTGHDLKTKSNRCSVATTAPVSEG